MDNSIWMLRHYSYDGAGRHDQYDVVYEFEKYKAFDYLLDMDLGEEYSWEEWGKDKEKVLIRKEGAYGYDYYYIQFMAPGEEID